MNFSKLDASVSVAFSGYRPDKLQKTDPGNNFLFAEIQARLLSTIHSLVEQGYNTFLSGMAAGFDLIAASAVLLAKNVYPDIRLIAVLPFPEQSAKYTLYWKTEYLEILQKSDCQITISDHYRSGVYHRRNDFLIDHSSVIVCYYDGQPGGTHYTVKKSMQHRLEIINLWLPSNISCKV